MQYYDLHAIFNDMFKWPMISFEAAFVAVMFMVDVAHLRQTHQLQAGDSQYRGPLCAVAVMLRSMVGKQLLRILPVASYAPHFPAYYLDILSG